MTRSVELGATVKKTYRFFTQKDAAEAYQALVRYLELLHQSAVRYAGPNFRTEDKAVVLTMDNCGPDLSVLADTGLMSEVVQVLSLQTQDSGFALDASPANFCVIDGSVTLVDFFPPFLNENGELKYPRVLPVLNPLVLYRDFTVEGRIRKFRYNLCRLCPELLASFDRASGRCFSLPGLPPALNPYNPEHWMLLTESIYTLVPERVPELCPGLSPVIQTDETAYLCSFMKAAEVVKK